MHASRWFLFFESAYTQSGSGELVGATCCAGIRAPTGPSRPVNLILAGSDRILRMRFSGGAPASAIRIRLLRGPAVPSSSSKGICPAVSRAAFRRFEWEAAPPTRGTCRSSLSLSLSCSCPTLTSREANFGCRCAACLAPSTSDAELHGAPALRAGLRLLKVLPTGGESRGALGIGRSRGRYVRYSRNLPCCITR